MLAELSYDRHELARLGPLAHEFAGRHHLPEPVSSAVHLALEEVVTNAICHGDDGHRGIVRIDLECSGSEVTIVVEDEGKPFDPLRRPDPRVDLPIEDRPIGGLGIYFVRQLMDDVAYVRVDGKNRLVMKKRWTPASIQPAS